MSRPVNGLGLRCTAASLALHGLLGLALTARALPLPGTRHHERRTSVAWSGDTFEVDDLAFAAAKHDEPTSLPRAEATAPAAEAPSEAGEPVSPRPASSKRTGATVVKMAATYAPASATGSAPIGASEAGAYGAAGPPVGVRSLPAAFCRAIPPATRADPSWQALPLGSAGSIQVVIEVDESGKIVRAEPDPVKHKSQPVAPHLKRLLDRTVLLLGAGAFALSAKTGAGTEKLLVEVELSETAASEDSEPTHMTSQGFVPPSPGRPGRAHFTLGSGRHFEARLTIVGN